MRKIFDKLFKKSVRNFIPQIQPWIDKSELIELKRVIDSTYISENQLTEEFESMTRDMTGSKHAIAMCNGTMALFACLKAMKIGLGDEVIVPNITFVASANAIILAGATPVVCEIYPNTFCIDVEKAEKLVTSKTKAIMPVHLYGQSADMDKITVFATKYNIEILEDAAQGVGVKFNGKHTGTFGKAGVLSYYANKTITCGEGGIVLTDDDEFAKECYRLKNHGRDKKGLFIHDSIGYNFSFTEMQAAIGVSQMKKLPKIIIKKKTIYDTYLKELSSLDAMRPQYIDERASPVFWFVTYLCKEAKELAEFLQISGIQTRKFFYPLNMQPCYSNNDIVKNIKGDFKLSETIYNEGISLPSSYILTKKEQFYVITKIKEFYENRN
ncbi:DegT/DnrJ/EryC1/StrS family aminotransferase [Flavobacteriaceae bacterium]|nr:DegT/DnrJ/EryC1/StrS family aminotransferase [Flavobacteriaceae bacterium]